MLKRAMASFLLVLATTAPLFAEDAKPAAPPEPPAPPTLDLSKAPSGIYTIDKGHAFILYKISHLGFSNYRGRMDDFDSQLTFDAKDPEKSSLSVVINTASTDSNNPKLDDHYHNTFFNIAKFPTATFKSTKVTKTGPDTGKVEGELTLLGVTKPVTLDVKFHGYGIMPFVKKETLGFSAVAHIKRSDFGMTAYLPMVGDDVDLEIEAEYSYAPGKSANNTNAYKD